MASVFVASNRNKSSIELDLKSDEARATIRALIGRADCLVHNMRPTAARRLGIGPDTALEINPRLIHAAVTGTAATVRTPDVPPTTTASRRRQGWHGCKPLSRSNLRTCRPRSQTRSPGSPRRTRSPRRCSGGSAPARVRRSRSRCSKPSSDSP
ncbi:hypothetical protein GTA28_24140 [Rhodococcus hoagii]|nr:hypothetical protein [Prescottella equi]